MQLSLLAYETAVVFGQNPYCPTLPIFPVLRFYTAQEQEENYRHLVEDSQRETLRHLVGDMITREAR